MRQRTLKLLLAIGTSLLLITNASAQINVTWDGGDGEWNQSMWNGGMTIESIIGASDGADGFDGPLEEVQNIIIPSGTVSYDANTRGSDFEMHQGSTLTIQSGAVWQQVTESSWTNNRWTQMDVDSLNIDGGVFRRTGAARFDDDSPPDPQSGGALIFGSWQGDDGFGKPAADPRDNQETYINITNGGRLENEGQLWFGSWGDTAPNGTVIAMTINDGHVDLTGGTVTGIGEFADADLVFSNRFNINNDPETDQPSYSINFTGPGSITVDRSGIVNAFQADSFLSEYDPDSLLPVGYESLWDAGILQAHGQSGPDGASFGDYFTTQGQLGQDDYMLVSNVAPLPGTILGIGTEALIGNDLTDLGDDGDETAYSDTDTAGFDATFFSSDEPGFGGGESAFNVFDNTLGPGNDKWCCGTGFPQIVGADLGREVELTHFTVSSANDIPGRDPRVWSIEGSSDGENWTTIFSHSDPNAALWNDRLQVIRFDAGSDFEAPTESYSQFRMVTESTGLTEGAFFQLGEIEFFGNVVDGGPTAVTSIRMATSIRLIEQSKRRVGPVHLWKVERQLLLKGIATVTVTSTPPTRTV